MFLQNKYLPARERVDDQTTKAPTGPYDRQKLLDHMREEALNSEVGKDWVPFEKKTRGKVYKPKPKKDETSAKSILPDELTDVLENASEEELMELAGTCIDPREALKTFRHGYVNEGGTCQDFGQVCAPVEPNSRPITRPKFFIEKNHQNPMKNL